MEHICRRKSIRIEKYDYSQTGAYFITICAQDHKHLFGKIVNKEMVFNEFGEIVQNEWLKTAKIRKNVELDVFAIMPNHFHCIIVINNNCRGVLQYAPTGKFRSPSQTVGSIVRGFKSATTKQINILRGTPCMAVWQRNYYEHVIRNDESLNKIREYVMYNPLGWDTDIENQSYINNFLPNERTKQIRKHNDELYS